MQPKKNDCTEKNLHTFIDKAPVRAPACPINFFAPGKCIAGTVRHRLRAAPSAHLHLFCRRRRHNKFDSLRARARHSLLPFGSSLTPRPRRLLDALGVSSAYARFARVCARFARAAARLARLQKKPTLPQIPPRQCYFFY